MIIHQIPFLIIIYFSDAITQSIKEWSPSYNHITYKSCEHDKDINILIIYINILNFILFYNDATNQLKVLFPLLILYILK